MNDTDFISAAGGYEYTPLPPKEYLDSMYPDIPDDTKEFIRIDKQETPDGNVFTMKVDDGMRPWGHSDLEYLANMNKETNQNGFWKYSEGKVLKELEEYLSSTYYSHYTSEESKTQTLDLIESIGDGEAFARSNAIKYLSRFGKKKGKSRLDILKAMHYCILLYHFSGLHKQNTDNYETF